MNSTQNDVPEAGAAGPQKQGLNMLQVFVLFTIMICGVGLAVRRLDPEVRDVSAAIELLSDASARVQARATQVSPGSAKVMAAGMGVDVQTRGAQHRVQLESRDAAGIVTSAVVQGEFVPAAPKANSPADLPGLTDEALARARATPLEERTVITGNTRLMGPLEGLIVVSPGARLVLRDVVLDGSVISSTVLDGIVGEIADAPEIIVEGSLRIDSGSKLPGLAILAPTGSFSAGQASSVQILGDVVARSVQLSGSGSLFGHVATVGQPRLSHQVAQLNDPRLEAPWSPSLQLDGSRARFLAFPNESTDWNDVTAMTSFNFSENAR